MYVCMYVRMYVCTYVCMYDMLQHASSRSLHNKMISGSVRMDCDSLVIGKPQDFPGLDQNLFQNVSRLVEACAFFAAYGRYDMTEYT